MERPLHGKYLWRPDNADVDRATTHQWLSCSSLNGETESFILAAQDQSISTQAYQSRILNNNPNCRLCTERERERKYVNCRATVYTLPVNICRFFIPTFHKNFHPNRWNVFFIKILLFQSLSRLKLFLDYGKLLHRPLPPKNIKTKKQKNGNCFSNNKLSISNKESYLARPKQSHEFHKIICRFCVWT